MSHLGRPDGKVNPKYSLAPVVPELEKLLGGKKVVLAPDSVGKEVEDIVNKATDGQVVLLENLRFHAEEEGSYKDTEGKKVKADKEKVAEFRKGLTALGDIFISEYCLTEIHGNSFQLTNPRRCLRNRTQSAQLHGRCRPPTKGLWFPHEEGTRVLCQGS